MNKKKAIIVSGYFNPLHKGHLEYFNNAKALCDELFVIVNNDHQRALKGSKEFQEEKERMMIISNIKIVIEVLTPTHYMKPGVVDVPLDCESDLEIFLLAKSLISSKSKV